jgi:hypothetical protein
MRRIYLDQLVWIAFARAALGRRTKPEVNDALEIARFGAELSVAMRKSPHVAKSMSPRVAK